MQAEADYIFKRITIFVGVKFYLQKRITAGKAVCKYEAKWKHVKIFGLRGTKF